MQSNKEIQIRNYVVELTGDDSDGEMISSSSYRKLVVQNAANAYAHE